MGGVFVGTVLGLGSKEVWSLVAFLSYLAILRVRIDCERPWRLTNVVGGLLGLAVFVIVGSGLAPLSVGELLGLVAAAAVVTRFVVARGQFATAAKSIVAFWTIMMTYVGGNYVLGTGLHGYGFGTGAVVRYLYLTGGIDLAVVAACALVHALRGASSLPGVDVPAPYHA